MRSRINALRPRPLGVAFTSFLRFTKLWSKHFTNLVEDGLEYGEHHDVFAIGVIEEI
jgi:hypothetical protein